MKPSVFIAFLLKVNFKCYSVLFRNPVLKRKSPPIFDLLFSFLAMRESLDASDFIAESR